jgi:PhnB protein
MAFVPVLQFRGNCAEAMQHYAEIFESYDLRITRYFEAPPEAGFPPSDRVLQALLRVGTAELSGMDFPAGIDGDPPAGFAVGWEVPDAAEGQRLFARLAVDGFVILPFLPRPWTAGMGMLKDRYGVHWIIGTPGRPVDL